MHFSGDTTVPYRFLPKHMLAEDIKQLNPYENDMFFYWEMMPGDDILVIRDVRKFSGQKFCFAPSKLAFDKCAGVEQPDQRSEEGRSVGLLRFFEVAGPAAWHSSLSVVQSNT